MCHMSFVTCRVSGVTCHVSLIFFDKVVKLVSGAVINWATLSGYRDKRQKCLQRENVNISQFISSLNVICLTWFVEIEG